MKKKKVLVLGTLIFSSLIILFGYFLITSKLNENKVNNTVIEPIFDSEPKIEENTKILDIQEVNFDKKVEIHSLKEGTVYNKEGEYILRVASKQNQYFKLSYTSLDSCSFSDIYEGQYTLEKIIYLRKGDEIIIQGDFVSSSIEYNSSILAQNC